MVGESDGDSVGDSNGDSVGVADGRKDGVAVGRSPSNVGETDGCIDGATDGDTLGDMVVGVTLGERFGVKVGGLLGNSVGDIVGEPVRPQVRCTFGDTHPQLDARLNCELTFFSEALLVSTSANGGLSGAATSLPTSHRAQNEPYSGGSSSDCSLPVSSYFR